MKIFSFWDILKYITQGHEDKTNKQLSNKNKQKTLTVVCGHHIHTQSFYPLLFTYRMTTSPSSPEPLVIVILLSVLIVCF